MRALVATCKIWQVWKWISIIHHLSVGCSVFRSSLNGVRRGRSIIGAMFHPSCRSDLYLGTTISSCSSVWDRIKFPECSGGMFFLKATNFVVAQHRNKWIHSGLDKEIELNDLTVPLLTSENGSESTQFLSQNRKSRFLPNSFQRWWHILPLQGNESGKHLLKALICSFHEVCFILCGLISLQ